MADQVVGDFYDVVVIGAGCMGSACARHLTTLHKGKICLIGPEEPTVARQVCGRSVFAAHYDEGRITRTIDADPVWTKLAQRSIKRYRSIESSTGIQYYKELGFLFVSSINLPFLTKAQECASSTGVNYQVMKDKELKSHFPYLHIPNDFVGMYEPSIGGYITPRGQVKAEIKAAIDNGCHVIREIVDRVSRNDDGTFVIVTESNQKINTRKIVVATGAFTLFKHLLPTDVANKLDIKCGTQTVVKFEVAENDLQQFQDMPAIVHKHEQPSRDCYILPPIRYPNGKYYLKFGHDRHFIKDLPTHDKVIEWFHGNGDPQAKEALIKLKDELIPNFKPVSIETDSCAYTITPTHRVMIGEVADNLVLLTGGNGHAAKSADEIGRIGALTVLNDTWNYDIPAQEFKLCYK